MDPLLPTDDGHTPLTEEERRGLIPTYVATRGDLNDAEQRNILKASRRARPTVAELLDDLFLRSLHRTMFEDVWKWAGEYRSSEVNIGIDPILIPVEVRHLVEDAKTWADSETYPPNELAVRFHHRLVQIHPFPKGNGRHGRLAADYLIQGLGHSAFTWGRKRQASDEAVRAAYIHALREADRGDLSELLEFVGS